MYQAFVRAKGGCDKWHDYEMSVAPYETDKPIYYEFTACPTAEFAIKHGLTDIMPALCNVDFASMELLHARLIRTNTCVDGCQCDYTICGDKDPYLKGHPEYRDEAGFRRNPAVLFFHAMGVTGASSEPIARYLQDRYFCILPTSTVYCEGQKYVSKLDEIRQVEDFLHRQGVERLAMVVASSIGADLAMAFLTQTKLPVEHAFFDGGQFAQIGKGTRRIMTLYARKVCSELYPNLYRDETAVRLIDEIDYDFSEAEKNSRGLMQRFGSLEVAMRQNDLAFEVRDYLKSHPNAAVVNLGCGLDSTGRSCDNGSCKIYNLDFPDVIAVRNELLPAGEREENIPCDLNNTEWFIKIDSSNGAVFFSSGVFYYFCNLNHFSINICVVLSFIKIWVFNIHIRSS